MIKLVEDLSVYDLSLFEDDIFFQRIYSDFSKISKLKDVFFYVCEEEEEITAVISKVCGVITISAKDNANFEEMNEFVKVIGFTVILCDNEFSCHFDGKKTSGKIMKFRTDTPLGDGGKLLPAEKLKDVYRIVRKNFRHVPDFPEWFVNTCLGMIRNSIMLAGVYQEDIIVSVAFALFITEKSAVISSVATDNKFKYCGYGRKVVNALIDANLGKDMYVFVENALAEDWYRKMGFTYCKMWSEIENVL